MRQALCCTLALFAVAAGGAAYAADPTGLGVPIGDASRADQEYVWISNASNLPLFVERVYPGLEAARKALNVKVRIAGPTSEVEDADLRRQLLARAVALGPRWASEARSGEVALLATRGLDALDGYFARYLPQLALAAIVPAVVVVCLAVVDVVAALTVLLTVPLIPVFMVLVGVGGALLLGVGRLLAETNVERDASAVHPVQIVRNYADIVAPI